MPSLQRLRRPGGSGDESEGALVRVRSVDRLPTPSPLGSLDTLSSPLNHDGRISIKAYESRKSHGKIGDCEQSEREVSPRVEIDPDIGVELEM